MDKTHEPCRGGGPPACASPPPEIAATLAVVSGKWRVLIIWSLYRGPVRFNALKRGLAGITQYTLTRQLRELEMEGIVTRQVFAEVPLRVEYILSTHGRTLGGVLRVLAAWGQTHVAQRPAPAPPRRQPARRRPTG